MIAALFSWLASGGVAAIGKQLNNAYAARLAAQNTTERIDADKMIAALEARRAVLIAEQGSWRTSWIRPFYAAIFGIYLAKVVVWDKVFGLGVTDPLSPWLEGVFGVILAAFFFSRPHEKSMRR